MSDQIVATIELPIDIPNLVPLINAITAVYPGAPGRGGTGRCGPSDRLWLLFGVCWAISGALSRDAFALVLGTFGTVLVLVLSPLSGPIARRAKR